MSDKSFTTLEQAICIVCGKPYDTGSILIDQRMRNRFDMHTITHVGGLCPEDQKRFDEGYIALVEADMTKSNPQGDRLKLEAAHRTGVVVHMKREAFRDVFNTEITDDLPMVFIEIGVADRLLAMMPKEDRA